MINMANKDKRKTIMVEEACFNDFNEKRTVLGLNSTELLQNLLQSEIERTTVFRIDKGTSFDHIAKEMSKCGFGNLCGQHRKEVNLNE
jgi:hypothetical protein